MPAQALHLVQTSEKTSPKPDGLLHLARNLNIHPDTLIGDGNGILGTGMPGSGKTTLLALLLEQFGRCGLPFSVFDLEGDLTSIVPFLPKGVLATATNCPGVLDMYGMGLQVIFDIETFGQEQAALLISHIVNGLMAHVKALPHHARVPFLIGLDEAAYWLPQKRTGNDHLTVDQLKGLFGAFHGLAIRGRKMGLVPLLFTQRFADIHKDVLSPGTSIFMKQTLDTDLKRYLEYISASAFGEDEDDMTQNQIKKRIAAFRKGQAVIKLPNGKQGLVQFHNRQSPHTSHAPKTQAAVNLYRDVPFDPQRQYGSAQREEEGTRPLDTEGSKLSLTDKERGVPGNHPSRSAYREQIFALLDADPDLTPKALAVALKYPSYITQRYRREYFQRYPEKSKHIPTVKEQIFALLDADPSLSVKALASATGHAPNSLWHYRDEYFLEHPERRTEESPTIKEQVFSLLEEDPSLTATALATLTGRPIGTMQKCRQEYLAHHPEKMPPKPPPKVEPAIRHLLAENPNYTASQLVHRTGFFYKDVKKILARIQAEAEGGQPC
jgi:hypothetical protein